MDQVTGKVIPEALRAPKHQVPLPTKKRASGRTSDFAEGGQSGVEPSNATHHADRTKLDGINLGPGR